MDSVTLLVALLLGPPSVALSVILCYYACLKLTKKFATDNSESLLTTISDQVIIFCKSHLPSIINEIYKLTTKKSREDTQQLADSFVDFFKPEKKDESSPGSFSEFMKSLKPEDKSPPNSLEELLTRFFTSMAGNERPSNTQPTLSTSSPTTTNELLTKLLTSLGDTTTNNTTTSSPQQVPRRRRNISEREPQFSDNLIDSVLDNLIHPTGMDE